LFRGWLFRREPSNITILTIVAVVAFIVCEPDGLLGRS
jgi:hypothetical protein